MVLFFGSRYLVSGTVDGFIEIWNTDKGKLDTKTFQYQGKDDMMMMDSGITSLALFDDRLLASGSAKGVITVWDIATGLAVKNFKTAHTQGVNSLIFTGNGERVVSASMDHTIKIHGIKSGTCLGLFRGHTSFCNAVVEDTKTGAIISGASDGTVKVFLAPLVTC